MSAKSATLEDCRPVRLCHLAVEIGVSVSALRRWLERHRPTAEVRMGRILPAHADALREAYNPQA